MSVNVIITVFFLGVLVFGLIQSRKHHFREGFYFFLLLIMKQIYSFIAPFFTYRMMDNLISNDSIPMGMSAGEFASLVSLPPKIIEIIAFAILVVGLYRMWNFKST